MSASTCNTEEGHNGEKDYCSGDHGGGGNHIISCLPPPKEKSSNTIFDADVLSVS